MGIFVGLSAVFIHALSARLWRADLYVPFRYDNDAEGTLMVVKAIIDHGWVQENPSLGAPFGQTYYDFPIGGDNLNFALIWLLARFSANAALVTNLFFLLTFALVAVAAWFVLEDLGVRRPIAFAGAVLYALTPFHLSRSENHLLLSSYFVLPIAFYLGLRLYRGDLGAGINRRARVLSWIGVTLSCAAIASTGAYFTVFGAFLIVLLGAAGLVRHRRLRTQGTKLLICLVLVFGVSTLNQVQSLRYRASHGTNREVATRQPAESEAYALKLAGLLTPTPLHPVGPLASARARYEAKELSTGASTEPLGTVAAAGFLLLLIAVPGLALLGRPPGGTSGIPEEMGPLAVATIGTFLLATVGGLSSLLAIFVSPQIRAWDRAGLVLAFTGIAAVCLLVSRLTQRLPTRVPARLAPVGAGALLLVFGVLDQATPAYVPNYSNTAAEYKADQRFVRSVVDHVGTNAVILQLPYHGFPETGPLAPGSGDYAQVRGFLHAPKSVRWSFGAFRGRPTDIVRVIAAQPPRELVASAVGAGFTDVWVDRAALGALGATSTEAALSQLLGPPTLASVDARYAIYRLGSARKKAQDLADSRAMAQLRDVARRPTLVSVNGPGVIADPSVPGTLMVSGTQRVEFFVKNPTDRPRFLSIVGQVPVSAKAQILATVAPAQGASARRVRRSRGTGVTSVKVPAGSSTLRLATIEVGPRPAGTLELMQLSIVDQPLRRFGARLSFDVGNAGAP
jgi:phosphoglycerol transferase